MGGGDRPVAGRQEQYCRLWALGADRPEDFEAGKGWQVVTSASREGRGSRLPQSPLHPGLCLPHLRMGQAWCPETRQETVVLLVAPGVLLVPLLVPPPPFLPLSPHSPRVITGCRAEGLTPQALPGLLSACVVGSRWIKASFVPRDVCGKEQVPPGGPPPASLPPPLGVPLWILVDWGPHPPRWAGEAMVGGVPGGLASEPCEETPGSQEGLLAGPVAKGLQFQQGTLEPLAPDEVWRGKHVALSAVRFTFRGPLPKRGLKQSMFLAQHLLWASRHGELARWKAHGAAGGQEWRPLPPQQGSRA